VLQAALPCALPCSSGAPAETLAKRHDAVGDGTGLDTEAPDGAINGALEPCQARDLDPISRHAWRAPLPGILTYDTLTQRPSYDLKALLRYNPSTFLFAAIGIEKSWGGKQMGTNGRFLVAGLPVGIPQSTARFLVRTGLRAALVRPRFPTSLPPFCLIGLAKGGAPCAKNSHLTVSSRWPWPDLFCFSLAWSPSQLTSWCRPVCSGESIAGSECARGFLKRIGPHWRGTEAPRPLSSYRMRRMGGFCLAGRTRTFSGPDEAILKPGSPTTRKSSVVAGCVK